MPGYRSNAIRVSRGLAPRIPLSILLKLTGQKVIFPVYHLVSDVEVPHVKHLYPVKSISVFNQDLDFLLKNFEPIDLNSLIDHIEEKRILKRPSFFLSFDDGLQEFHSIIAPILLARGIPATNFLNTSFINNQALFFRYKVSLIIDQLRKENGIQSLKAIRELLQISTQTSKDLWGQLLRLRYSDSEKIDQIARILGIDFNQFLHKNKPYLTSRQIIDLINQGFTFGAHSVDHPMYSDVSLSEQIRQTEESITLISEKFELNHRIFAFPFTDYDVSRLFFDHFFRNRKLLDLSFGSAGLKRDIYPRHIQRIPMEMGEMTAQQIIHGEYLYYLVKALVGKNKVKRK